MSMPNVMASDSGWYHQELWTVVKDKYPEGRSLALVVILLALKGARCTEVQRIPAA